VEGQAGLALLACLLAAASLGFLFHNLPPARIFMGDIGSAFLGFTLAAMPLIAYVQTSNARMPVVGVLFVAPFVFDGTLTILRRALHRENIFKPHRSHLYQQLVIAGQSHRQITGQYQVLMLLGGICGLVYYTGTQAGMMLSFLVMLVLFASYATYVSVIQVRVRKKLM
jgi:UDP-N-acetylmuramyl pentapeptide phosphotransferase/UDP-N-acetylglucosamine-1-phosphate transferase